MDPICGEQLVCWPEETEMNQTTKICGKPAALRFHKVIGFLTLTQHVWKDAA